MEVFHLRSIKFKFANINLIYYLCLIVKKIVMSKPRRVYPKRLPEYDKLHTRKVKMFSGVEIIGLHLIKETSKFYMGFESWCFCCGKFKGIKSKTELKFDIPIISDKKALEFLNEHAWHDWVDRELKGGRKDSEMSETIALLDKLFPNKKKVYFYELKSLVAAFCGAYIHQGTKPFFKK